ncbi:hypothetical protein ACTFIR_000911 [Dictyostelium discoideum]
MNKKVKKTEIEEPFKKRLRYKTFKYCKYMHNLQQTHGTDTAAWNVLGSKEAKEMSQQATHALADLVRYTENLVFKEGYDGMAVHKEKKSVIEKFLDNKKIK